MTYNVSSGTLNPTIPYHTVTCQLRNSFRQPHQSCLNSPPHPLVNPSLSSSITNSLFHYRLKTYLFNKSFPPQTSLYSLYIGLPHDNGTRPDLSLSSFYFQFNVFNFLFIPCGRLSWLPVSFLLHIKYTLLYGIIQHLS